MRMSDEERAEWEAYAADPSDDNRNALAVRHLTMVTRIAYKVLSKMPPGASNLDDLTQEGMIGLFTAIQNFDIEYGYQFCTFASPRVYGSMIDYVRSLDYVGRKQRSRLQVVSAARDAAGLDATDGDVAERLGLTEDEFFKLEQSIAAPPPISLYDPVEERFEKRATVGDFLTDRNADQPFDRMQRKDMVVAILKGLSKPERMIMLLYYLNGMTMKQIGEQLDISESRVSQMHSQIIARLRADTRRRDLLCA